MRLFDLHCDTLSVCFDKSETLRHNTCHLDLKRGSSYDAWVQIFAVWISDEIRGEEAFCRCCNILEFAHKQLLNNADLAMEITTKKSFEKALSDRRCGVIFAVENGAAVAGKTENIHVLKELGVKVITLTWNGENEWGNGCFSNKKTGLSSFGKQALAEMEKLSVLPDVSHLNESGFWDVLEHTKAPVLATHSASSAVKRHPRNLTDAQFAALCERGGLVGLTICADHLGEQSFERLEQHLYHFWELGGENVVSLGADLDGTAVRRDWNGVGYASLFGEYLSRKNYSERTLSRLFFENAYDFFKHT